MNTSATDCYLCGATATRDFFEWPPLPTQDGIMCESEAEAHAVVRGSIKLRFCRRCGYVGNESHEAAKVQFDEYDFSNHQSPIYAQFTRELADRLIARHDLHGKSIIDIGCGQGDFLQAICRQGGNRGIGIDPGFGHGPGEDSGGADVRFLREYYGERHADLRADLVVSRHLISLPNDPLAFLSLLRRNLDDQPDTILYLETPNLLNTFGKKNIWNVVYEHRSWYSRESLGYMLERCGFEVLDTGLCWNDAYLYVEARPSANPLPNVYPPDVGLVELADCIDSVANALTTLMDKHARLSSDIRAAGKRAVAWGSGAAAVSYFNLFDLREAVPYIVDINPKRQGKYLPGSGQQIVAPEFVRDYRPELLIITNPTYEAEITAQVHSLGVEPDILTL